MVSRRSFLNAIAAAITVPIIDLRKAVPRENLLLKFCGEDARYSLRQPFSVGSLTYATDNRAMIRTELCNPSEVGEMKIPPVGRVWNEYWLPSGQWKHVDEQMLQPSIVKEWQLCPKCGCERVSYGEGIPPYPDVIELIGKYSYDTDDNTIRNRSCEVCHGLDYKEAAFSDVCGWPHSSFMLKRIAALPNAMVCRSATRNDAILFRADGFQGISLGWNDDK